MLRFLRRSVVTFVGVALVGVGLALMVLPGPGFLTVAAGLAVLATEYVWARRMLEGTRDRARQAAEAATQNRFTTTVTLICASGLIVLGVVFLALRDLPFASPASGVGLILGGIVLVTTTVLQLRQSDLLLGKSNSRNKQDS